MVVQMPHWSREEHHLFPAEFRAVVRQMVRGHYCAASVLNTVPMDVLELVIALLARDPYSFEGTPAPSESTEQVGSFDVCCGYVAGDRISGAGTREESQQKGNSTVNYISFFTLRAWGSATELSPTSFCDNDRVLIVFPVQPGGLHSTRCLAQGLTRMSHFGDGTQREVHSIELNH
jgi:hypothetical protein